MAAVPGAAAGGGGAGGGVRHGAVSARRGGLDLASVASLVVVWGLSGGEFGSPRSENVVSVSYSTGTTPSS